MQRITIAAVLLGACGGGDDEDATLGGSSGPSTSATTSTTASTTTEPGTGETSSSSGTTTGATTEASGSSETADASSSGTGPCGDATCAPDEDASTCCEDCGVCDDGATVRMETGSEAGAPGDGITPGGIADTHAYFAAGPYAELVYPFTIEAEPVAGSSWFWAQQFFFEGTDQGGYTGVQANGILNGQVVGKMVIGSIWDAIAAEPGPTASCEPFGGEGIGYSCRLAFEWRENVTYRMIVREVSADHWSISIHDPTVPAEILLGTIEVAEPWGRITPTTAGFAEYYGTVASCEALPHAVALLHAPLADATLPTSVNAGTYGTCATEATSVCTGNLCG